MKYMKNIFIIFVFNAIDLTKEVISYFDIFGVFK